MFNNTWSSVASILEEMRQNSCQTRFAGRFVSLAGIETIRGAAADEVSRFESLLTKNPSLEYFGLALFIGVKDNDQEFVSAATRGPSSQSNRLLSAIFWRRREAAH
jgi:hypothetical protein